MTVSSDLTTEAGAALSSWLHDDPGASGELGKAMRAHIHLQEPKRNAGILPRSVSTDVSSPAPPALGRLGGGPG